MKSQWLKKANTYMQHEYGIPVDHGCFTEDEFYARFGNDGEKLPNEAVDDFANKYDLLSRNEGWLLPDVK